MIKTKNSHWKTTLPVSYRYLIMWWFLQTHYLLISSFSYLPLLPLSFFSMCCFFTCNIMTSIRSLYVETYISTDMCTFAYIRILYPYTNTLHRSPFHMVTRPVAGLIAGTRNRAWRQEMEETRKEWKDGRV